MPHPGHGRHGKVTFRYQKCGATSWKTMTLSAQEFIRRFLQHVLPKGIHKVRYYGLWNPSQRRLLHQVQLVLARDAQTQSTPETNIPDEEVSALSIPEGKTCPQCGKGILVCIGHIPRPRRAPP
ncbi:transposase [Planctomycetota bacterium]